MGSVYAPKAQIGVFSDRLHCDLQDGLLVLTIPFIALEMVLRYNEADLRIIELKTKQRDRQVKPLIQGLTDKIANIMAPHFDTSSSSDPQRRFRLVLGDDTEFEAIWLMFQEVLKGHPAPAISIICSSAKPIDMREDITLMSIVSASAQSRSSRYNLRSQAGSSSASFFTPSSPSKSASPPRKILEYPKDEKDSVVLSSHDLHRLRSQVYLNDSIVDMWIKYLFKERYASCSSDFYGFSSFFWKKISPKDGEKEVSKWTGGVDIFTKKYLFIPVCQSAHWTLIFVVLPTLVPEDPGCILWLDSLGGSGNTAFTKIRRYLEHEFLLKKEKEDPASLDDDDTTPMYEMIRSLPRGNPSVPKQDNSTDCGLFMLQFIESLLTKPPQPPYPIVSLFSTHKSVSMFSLSEADAIQNCVKVKRREIYETIQQLRQQQGLSPLADFPAQIDDAPAIMLDDGTVNLVDDFEAIKDPDFVMSTTSKATKTSRNTTNLAESSSPANHQMLTRSQMRLFQTNTPQKEKDDKTGSPDHGPSATLQPVSISDSEASQPALGVARTTEPVQKVTRNRHKDSITLDSSSGEDSLPEEEPPRSALDAIFEEPRPSPKKRSTPPTSGDEPLPKRPSAFTPIRTRP
jgi:hypothetical protein